MDVNTYYGLNYISNTVLSKLATYQYSWKNFLLAEFHHRYCALRRGKLIQFHSGLVRGEDNRTRAALISHISVTIDCIREPTVPKPTVFFSITHKHMHTYIHMNYEALRSATYFHSQKLSSFFKIKFWYQGVKNVFHMTQTEQQHYKDYGLSIRYVGCPCMYCVPLNECANVPLDDRPEMR